MVRVDLRTVTLNVPPQEVITKDNVTVRVNAVAYFRVIDPDRAITDVENYLVATSQIAQTTLRSVLGKAELDSLLAERERLNQELQTIIDEQTEPWGIKVSTVEVKDVELPQDMQRAIALQAQAERERRAKIIGSEGEFQAAQKLADAADIISQNPATLQLRYLQTLLQIGVNNTTIVFPLPIDLMDAVQEARRRPAVRGRRSRGPAPDGRARARRPRATGRRRGHRTRRSERRGARQRRRRAPGDPDRSADRPARRCSRPAGASRPRAFATPAAEPAPDAADTCPFCAGREERTPPEVWANRPDGGAADGPGWLQRSVPEPLPGADRGRTMAAGAGAGPRLGADERRRPAAQLGSGERAGAVPDRIRRRRPRGDRQLAAPRRRARRPRRRRAGRGAGRLADPDRRPMPSEASLVHLCVNEGPLAGSTLPHTHAQLFALPFVPDRGRPRA